MNNISTKYQSFIICPYCGNSDRDSWEYNQFDKEYECENCGEISKLEVYVDVEYSTFKKED